MSNEIQWGKVTALYLSATYGEDAPMVGFSSNMYEDMCWEKEGLDAEEYSYVKPTKAELEAKWEEVKVVEIAKGVNRARAAAYPSLAEQADMQFHDAINGTTVWKDSILAVKALHPKAS